MGLEARVSEIVLAGGLVYQYAPPTALARPLSVLAGDTEPEIASLGFNRASARERDPRVRASREELGYGLPTRSQLGAGYSHSRRQQTRAR